VIRFDFLTVSSMAIGTVVTVSWTREHRPTHETRPRGAAAAVLCVVRLAHRVPQARHGRSLLSLPHLCLRSMCQGLIALWQTATLTVRHRSTTPLVQAPHQCHLDVCRRFSGSRLSQDHLLVGSLRDASHELVARRTSATLCHLWRHPIVLDSSPQCGAAKVYGRGPLTSAIRRCWPCVNASAPHALGARVRCSISRRSLVLSLSLSLSLSLACLLAG